MNINRNCIECGQVFSSQVNYRLLSPLEGFCFLAEDKCSSCSEKRMEVILGKVEYEVKMI